VHTIVLITSISCRLRVKPLNLTSISCRRDIHKVDRPPLHLAILERLLTGGHRTIDGSKADFYYVPITSRCVRVWFPSPRFLCCDSYSLNSLLYQWAVSEQHFISVLRAKYGAHTSEIIDQLS
jgi:hypothetical protein